jgi:hypothetical protein
MSIVPIRVTRSVRKIPFDIVFSSWRLLYAGDFILHLSAFDVPLEKRVTVSSPFGDSTV